MALGIRAVTEQVNQPVSVKGYEIDQVRMLKNADTGEMVKVVVNTVRITKQQLENEIARATAQLNDAKAKLDEINQLEAPKEA